MFSRVQSSFILFISLKVVKDIHCISRVVPPPQNLRCPQEGLLCPKEGLLCPQEGLLCPQWRPLCPQGCLLCPFSRPKAYPSPNPTSPRWGSASGWGRADRNMGSESSASANRSRLPDGKFCRVAQRRHSSSSPKGQTPTILKPGYRHLATLVWVRDGRPEHGFRVLFIIAVGFLEGD